MKEMEEKQMNFEYNSNLTFKERVDLVAKEIMSEYPLLSSDDAVKAAALATPVDDKVTNDAKFDRYYFILKNIDPSNEEFSHVFNDAFNVYQKGLKDDKYNTAMLGIIDYVNGMRADFPELLNLDIDN